MPSRNRNKQYIEKSYYHIYNRGVERRRIFMDKQDYSTFLTYLEQYLLPKNLDYLQLQLVGSRKTAKEKDKINKLLKMNNFNKDITLIAFALMPNHFHLLIRQKNIDDMDLFMNSILTRYSMYFNRKYKRVGPLYQGVYKAALIQKDSHLLHLTRYIHQQAIGPENIPGSKKYPSSYQSYLGIKKIKWVHPKKVLKYFLKINPQVSYKKFIQSTKSFEEIKDLIIEKD